MGGEARRGESRQTDGGRSAIESKSSVECLIRARVCVALVWLIRAVPEMSAAAGGVEVDRGRRTAEAGLS